MDLQIWRELGDISSPEYANKLVQVRKKQEQEFFNAGFDKSMIDLQASLKSRANILEFNRVWDELFLNRVYS